MLDQPAGAAPPAPADDAALLEAIVEAGARLAGKTAPALPRGLPDEAAHAEAAAALSDLGLLPSDAGAPAARALADRYRRAQAALGAWTPAPDPGAAAPLLVRGRGSAVEGPAADLGWAALCRGLRVAWVPGDHITMATGEGARDLARAVGEAVCESRS